jgi:hypothetical protein
MDVDAVFSLNPRGRPGLARIGVEQEPVFWVDDFFRDPQAVVDFAATEASFGPAGQGYPGLRASVPEIVNHALIHALQPVIAQIFAIGDGHELGLQTAFAIVTHGAGELQPAQRIPHFDVADRRALAIVVYLCTPGWGGTAFFRHRSTGFETVPPERNEIYNRRLAQELAMTPVPEGLPDGNHPLFEQLHCVEPVFNRLVLYRSRLLHSATPSDRPFSASPREGRLTITSFLRPA